MTRKPPSRSPRDDMNQAARMSNPIIMQLGIKPSGQSASAGPSEGQSSEEGMYQVGYCRPPLHSRFKPGQSGNPKGRPKQSRNMRTIVKQVSQRGHADPRGGPFASHVCDGSSRTHHTRACL